MFEFTEFQIRRGCYDELFSADGAPAVAIEKGTWYLCADTAELFLGTVSDSGEITLKCINEPVIKTLIIEATDKIENYLKDNYYTAKQLDAKFADVDTAIQNAIEAIPEVDLTNYITTDIMTTAIDEARPVQIASEDIDAICDGTLTDFLNSIAAEGVEF